MPEALIPLSLLAPPPAARAGAGPGWGAVLCGDPRQLGPVVRSQVRRKYPFFLRSFLCGAARQASGG